MEIKKLVQDLEDNSEFKKWKLDHPIAFISHLFTKINQDFDITERWDIGYFCQDKEKVTIFVKDDKNNFLLKNVDDVFKKKMDKVEPLNLSKAELNFQQAQNKVKSYLNDKFPNYQGLLGNGFVILQSLNEKIVWNFSIITKKMSMVNIKLSAVDGSFISKDEVNFLQQNA